MKLTYFGHSACLLETDSHKLLFDPFLADNPLSPVKPDEIECDYIILTHGHADHFGDTESIAKANDATVICNFELSSFCGHKGLKTHPLHIGGGKDFDFGRVKLTIAHHGSSYPGPDGLPIYLGEPAGVLVMADEKTFYHAGDTGLFLDMQLIGEMNEIDLAMLPIGDNFTMGIDDAVKATEFLKPKQVVPCHFNTFPPIACEPELFVQKIESLDIICDARLLSPGESTEI
ncbi:MAG: metal-dependent hydrolase [Verrucomicrobiota bacterium]